MSESPIAQAILDEIQRLATRFERVEGRVESLDNRSARLDSRMAGLEARMTNIETVVADLDGRIQSWPDMHYLAAAAKAQLANNREIKTDLADARIRIGEIFQAMPTDPEIRSLREEATRFREQSLSAEIGLGAIERRLGFQTAVEPP